MTRLGFYGAAGTVTGSKYLLEAGKDRILIDCGLFQGLKQLRLLNWEPTPFDPRSLDAVILTHAHIDHSGYLPRLVKAGFKGPIYVTEGTQRLAGILLRDSATLQEEDAEYANKKGFSKHHPALPLYTLDDAERALRHLEPIDSAMPFKIGEIEARFHGAGHILGSSFVELRVPADGESAASTLVFSGDLGRYDAPMHGDPHPLPVCDTIVVESTYGDRLHSEEPLDQQLRGPIAEALARGGTVMIPAFAVARAQLVVMLLTQLMHAGQLPRVPIHLDSPMAIEVSQAYASLLTSEDLDITRAELFPKEVRFHRTRLESQELNELDGPRIIIAGSGMMTGGRILHHMKRLLPDPKNLLLLVGYQAAGTRGRSISEGAQFVRIHGRDVPVTAHVVQVHGLSSHADRVDIQRWLTSGTAAPRTIFITHGEPEAAKALSTELAHGEQSVIIPRLNDQFELGPAGEWIPRPEWSSPPPNRSARRHSGR